jgi:hypothetical protein
MPVSRPRPTPKAVALPADQSVESRQARAVAGARAALVTGGLVGLWAALQPVLAHLR